MEEMDIIELTREIGRQLQKDERYLAMRAASEACDGDAVLQNLIGDFNLKRMAINNEANKEVRDRRSSRCSATRTSAKSSSMS